LSVVIALIRHEEKSRKENELRCTNLNNSSQLIQKYQEKTKRIKNKKKSQKERKTNRKQREKRIMMKFGA
jgi:hypothetical protein